MSATNTSRRSLAQRLERYRRRDGNWRLKGLLLALRDDVSARALGTAWPRHEPAAPTDYVQLGARTPDSAEHAVARSLYDRDAVQANEVVTRDEYIGRALVNESATELDVLWREELTETVVAGAAPRKVARDAATVDEVDARKGDLPAEGAEPFATTGAEAGNPEFNEVDYSALAYTCEKHEQGFAITDELADQARPAKIEEEIRKAGRAIENAINRQFINELLDNGTTYDAELSGSGNTDLRDLLMKASERAADADFDPTDTLVGHPEYYSELGGNNQLAGLNMVQSDTGSDDAVAGHDMFTISGTAYDSGTNTYGFETDGELGALVYNRKFVRLPIYRDIQVSDLQPPFTAIHDLQGGVASAWTDVVQAPTADDSSGTAVNPVIVVQR